MRKVLYSQRHNFRGTACFSTIFILTYVLLKEEVS